MAISNLVYLFRFFYVFVSKVAHQGNVINTVCFFSPNLYQTFIKILHEKQLNCNFFFMQVKQIMEEAVTRKFVHEESSSITSLCGKPLCN